MSSALPAASHPNEVEPRDLTELENVIEHGLETFVEVGQALLEIRDRKLYRERTFEDYCRERWGFRRETADRYIRSAEVVAVINPIGLTTPSNDAQARELAPLLSEPSMLVETWAEVQERAHGEGRPVTAALVREVVEQKRGWHEDNTFNLRPEPTGMGVHYSSVTDLWSTPQDLFDELDAEFTFTHDVCATADNTKCGAAFFGPGSMFAEDGLAQEWRGVCWMNPPYGDEITKWVAKARASAAAGATVVCLVPARVDTAWWWDNCRYGEVRFLRGRLKFGGGENSAPFPSAVVVFGREAKVLWWER